MNRTALTHASIQAGNHNHHHEAFHSLSNAETLAILRTSTQGLATEEAKNRLAEYGPNLIPKKAGDTLLLIFGRQLNSPIIYVLIVSAILALLLGKITDGIVVALVVIANAVLGTIQEFRASKAIESLSELLAERALVFRDALKQPLEVADLVPGDLVSIEAGDKIPADLRLVSVSMLKINESSLTGESLPAEKSERILPADTPLNDRENMAYSGTFVTSGSARGVVVATGQSTELGKISQLLESTTSLETPLGESLKKLGNVVTVSVGFVAALLIGVGLWRGYSLVDAMLAGITLAVAAIPEGLPAVVTITLAIGVRRMAKRRAIVRRLPTVETLGSASVICSDKTGTLTKNEMTVQKIMTLTGNYDVEGEGYAPHGKIFDRNQKPVNSLPQDAVEVLRAGILCSDAHLKEISGKYEPVGDPTEVALLVAARKAGLNEQELREQFPTVDILPFNSEHQYMATLHNHSTEIGRKRMIYAKGAAEVILSKCHFSPESIYEQVMSEVSSLSSKGLRVLAFAAKRINDPMEKINPSLLQSDLEFLGLQAMLDPPRPEAAQAIASCYDAGIEIKMITGDHAGTAKSIASRLGIRHSDRVLTGREIETMNDHKLVDAAIQTNVFARVAPEHKLRLVRALQAKGHIAAMTGDGVNDAPALKQSNIGVAMGITGTSVAKEAADLVLTDDNFASIRAAVEEGRRIFDNLKKSLAFILPTNLGEALIILIATLFFPIVNGSPIMPITPIQILWINLVATVSLALPLAFEAMEPNVMKRGPRNVNSPMIDRFVLSRTVRVAIFMAASAIALFLYEYYIVSGAEGYDPQAISTAQTVAVTHVIALQIFYLFNCRSMDHSVFKIGFFANKSIFYGVGTILVLQGLFVYSPFMNQLFGTAPLSPVELIKAFAVGAIILPVIAIEKAFRKKEVL